jgi:thioredoxin
MRSRMHLSIVCALVVGFSVLLSNGYAAEPKINLQALMAKRVPILLEFGRGWCIPCKYMKPILADMSKAYTGKAIVMTVDMDANKDLVRNFRIRMMPTQVFLTPDGKEFRRNEGTLEREQIAQVFSQMGLPAPGQQGAARSPVPQAMPSQGKQVLPPGSPRW